MKIAIFGAGQLAMMMVQADTEKKHEYTVIDPSESPPASKYTKHIQTEYSDINTIKKISNDCDLATIDFENVDVVRDERNRKKNTCSSIIKSIRDMPR
jgi:5-(carboxyamino)imidazole ribonucleotide synthase